MAALALERSEGPEAWDSSWLVDGLRQLHERSRKPLPLRAWRAVMAVDAGELLLLLLLLLLIIAEL